MKIDKMKYYLINGVFLGLNLILYFGFCNNNIVQAFVKGLGVKFWIVLFLPVLFVSLNYLEKMSLEKGWEKYFVFIDDLLHFLNFIIFLTILIMGIDNILNGLDYFTIKLIYLISIVVGCFNIYYIIKVKE